MTNSNSIQSQPDAIPWWKKYLTVVIYPFDERLILYSHFAFILPWIILISAVVVTAYITYSSENYINKISEKIISRASAKEEIESAERAIENTKPILRNPVYLTILSMESAMVVTRSLLMVLFMVWIFLTFLFEWRNKFLRYILAVSNSTGIIVLGIIIYTVVRLIFQEDFVAASPIAFIKSYNHLNPFDYILMHAEIFTLYFFWIASAQTISLFQEKVFTLFMLFVSSWVILHIVAFLSGFEFYIMPI